jgi:hypothetical protein
VTTCECCSLYGTNALGFCICCHYSTSLEIETEDAEHTQHHRVKGRTTSRASTMNFKRCASLITTFKRPQKFQVRRMAEESQSFTDIPPPPPDNSSLIAIGGIVTFGVLCTIYIASLPENNYDSIGLMSAPGQVPPEKKA